MSRLMLRGHHLPRLRLHARALHHGTPIKNIIKNIINNVISSAAARERRKAPAPWPSPLAKPGPSPWRRPHHVPEPGPDLDELPQTLDKFVAVTGQAGEEQDTTNNPRPDGRTGARRGMMGSVRKPTATITKARPETRTRIRFPSSASNSALALVSESMEGKDTTPANSTNQYPDPWPTVLAPWTGSLLSQSVKEGSAFLSERQFLRGFQSAAARRISAAVLMDCENSTIVIDTWSILEVIHKKTRKGRGGHVQKRNRSFESQLPRLAADLIDRGNRVVLVMERVYLEITVPEGVEVVWVRTEESAHDVFLETVLALHRMSRPTEWIVCVLRCPELCSRLPEEVMKLHTDCLWTYFRGVVANANSNNDYLCGLTPAGHHSDELQAKVVEARARYYETLRNEQESTEERRDAQAPRHDAAIPAEGAHKSRWASGLAAARSLLGGGR